MYLYFSLCPSVHSSACYSPGSTESAFYMSFDPKSDFVRYILILLIFPFMIQGYSIVNDIGLLVDF